jgi:5-(carboxyamino)imidazole ribonucleotide synthase
MCEVVTYEFEHINSAALIELEKEGHTIYPSPASLRKIQNKISQKNVLKANHIPVGDFMAVDCAADLVGAAKRFGFPYFMKSATGGYDGKGNFVIHNEEEAAEVFGSLTGRGLPVLAEALVDYSMEVSVLACRAIDGSVEVYPVAQNEHRLSVLYETAVPADISEETSEDAMRIASDVMVAFGGVGMFCVEMFVCRDGSVLVNEVAPRPHNSGHYSIEACMTSQFEQHVRAICGLPLGSAELKHPIVMRNLLGPEDCKKPFEYDYAGIGQAMGIKGFIFHSYGKKTASRLRKLGHFTVSADTVEHARSLADKARDFISIQRRDENNG